MDHRSSAREILSAIGGKENLVSAAHCATRLRLIIADNSKIQKDTLENIDVVKGVFEASGQLQIIIGTGTVNKVYDEFIAEAGVEASSKDEVKAQVGFEKQNWFKRLIKNSRRRIRTYNPCYRRRRSYYGNNGSLEFHGFKRLYLP